MGPCFRLPMFRLPCSVLRQTLPTARGFHLSVMAPIAVGDKVPTVTLYEDSPANKVDIGELCAGKKGAGGKVRMLADTCGEFAKALDLQLDISAVLGSVRCKRFSMLVEDGTVSKLNVEPDGTGLTCSLAGQII